MKTIFYNNKKYDFEETKKYYDVAKYFEKEIGKKIFLVKSNNYIKELFRDIDDEANVDFIYADDKEGNAAYENTAKFILFKAVAELFPDIDLYQDFSIRNGLYFTRNDKKEFSEEDIKNITNKMDEIISKKILIKKHYVPVEKALKLFKNQYLEDKIRLCRYKYTSGINVYELDKYIDYFAGSNLYDTSYIDKYKIEKYHQGLIMIIPSFIEPDLLPEFKTSEKLFNMHAEAFDWSKKLNANTAGKINELIAAGGFGDMILMQESYMDKNIGDIAVSIKNSGKKIILVSGPSSSGKTSFTFRLSYHLQALGITAKLLSVDNFFVNRVDTPKDENGDYDYESIHTINLKLFNTTLSNLLNGDITLIPTFDFVTGTSKFTNKSMMLDEGDVLLIEGIHAMNDEMTYSVPNDLKYRIYVSALTEVNIDNHNRIPTSDLRLLRRICRDTRTRGFDPIDVINMWGKVRKGEEKNIFPYQENADIMFNTSLIYELPILKIYAEPMLYNIPRGVKNYDIVNRLVRTLSYFVGGTYENVPNHSIIKEFIGRSVLDVG